MNIAVLDFSNPTGSSRKITRSVYFIRDTVVVRVCPEPIQPLNALDDFRLDDVTAGGRQVLTQRVSGLRCLGPGPHALSVHIPVRGGRSLEIVSTVMPGRFVQIMVAWRGATLKDDFSRETFFYTDSFEDIHAADGRARFVFQNRYRWEGLALAGYAGDSRRTWQSALYPYAQEPAVRLGGNFASASHFQTSDLPLRLNCHPEEWATPYLLQTSVAWQFPFGRFPVPVVCEAGTAVDARFSLFDYGILSDPHSLVTVGEHLLS
ncbi:MAG: hypothetical protein KIT79_16035 [Deltaproteobacteria bacterium]|nr:hypothetical protein [Deltaproteobacteria bacterium]